jgi:hypothetical protein
VPFGIETDIVRNSPHRSFAKGGGCRTPFVLIIIEAEFVRGKNAPLFIDNRDVFHSLA